jgi:hypothetical protein
MRQHGCLVAALALIPVTASADSGRSQQLTAAVGLTKDRFRLGEPIGVRVIVRNPGPQPAHVQLEYPLMFTHGMSLVRFDAGPAMTPLPVRPMAFSGAFLRFSTELPAGATWSRQVYLQNYVSQAPPGVYRVGYHFETSYLLRPPGDKENQLFGGDDVQDDHRIEAEGSLAVRITEPDPAALRGVLEGVVGSYRERARGRRADAGARWEAIEALKAVDGPTVIPYVLKAIPANDPDDAFGLDDLFQILDRVRDRPEARQGVVGLVGADNPGVDYRALGWLRDAKVTAGPEVLVSFFDRAIANGSHPESAFMRYLHDVPVRPTPELRDRVARCLSGDNLVEEVALALVVLSRWGVPRDTTVRAALDRLTGKPDMLDSPDDSVVIEALGAWGLALDADVLRPRLRERPAKPIPSFAPFLRYIRAFAPERYRSLEPDVAALLRVGRDDEVMIEALKTLDRWGHVLTPDEVNWLMDQEPQVGEATQAYMMRHRAH